MRRAVAARKFSDYNILPDEWEWSAEDRARIIRLLRTQDLECSDLDAYYMWADHSDDYCAGWLIMPESDEHVLEGIAPYYTIEETE